MGKVMGNEGEINNSLFEINKEPIKGSHTRIIYPILVSGSFAFAYLFGLETSKIMTSLFLVAFVIVYYGLLKRISSPTAAIIFTFLMIITPEMYAFTSLSTTNIPFAIYTAIGYLYLYLWLTERKNGDLLLAAIFMALCCWTRSEGIFFLLAGSLVLLYSTVRDKTWKEFFMFISPGLLLFFVWNLYVKFNFNIEQNVFQTTLFWDAEKISIILNWVINLVTDTGLYGISFYMLILIILLNLKFLIQRDISTYLLSLILLSFFSYILLFYQLDNANLDPIEIMMKTSYRRGIFVFIPMIWFYVLASKVTGTLINKIKRI
ncbi:MAG: glycosyltransferase family 39 protein [Calditrichaceae bacterium]|nr:glycosyltransferase family 39 protein [Calditrichaceae bacterium]